MQPLVTQGFERWVQVESKKRTGQGRCAKLVNPNRLEHQSQRELQLAGRTGIAGWEARAVDDAKGWHRWEREGYHRGAIGGCRPGLAVVRVIEEIERVHPELSAQSLGDLGPLQQSQVQVLEVRTNHGVAAEITKGAIRRQTQNRRVYDIGKVGVLERISHLDGTTDVGANSVHSPVDGGRGQDDI